MNRTMKTFKEVGANDTLFRVCFSDYSVETLEVHAVGHLKYDGRTMIDYTLMDDRTVIGRFVKEVYEEDLNKCWLYDTLSYAICTDYEAIDVAIRENNPNYRKPKRKKI